MSRNLGIVLAALCVALGLGSTARALITSNVLLNVPWTSNKNAANAPGDSGYFPYSPGPYHGPLIYTDGSTTTWDYQDHDSVITYDLGSTVNGLATVGVATNGAVGSRNNPKFITLKFYDSSDVFITSDMINLADTMADQDVSFPSVTARYVQFVMPTNVSGNFYTDPGRTASDYVLPSEFELYAPEPASLSLLAAGGLLILRRRRGNARV